jgi:hypothetical protein
MSIVRVISSLALVIEQGVCLLIGKFAVSHV